MHKSRPGGCHTGGVGGLQSAAPVAGLVMLAVLGALTATVRSAAGSEQTQLNEGRRLYLQHCAACHGENGDGQGIAAPFLFPKPRNFRSGKFRLVSTSNNVPTVQDLDAVLVRGMPGSSMPPWAHLTPSQRQAIIQEVLRLFREGMREQYVRALVEQEGLTPQEIQEDPDIQAEVEEFVRQRTTPGPGQPVPEIPAPDAQAVARGREIYFRQSCHSCHGNEGRGDGVKEQFDDDGFPTRPRDYTRGIFKASDDPTSLYLRVAYGMPGTPMPSSPQLKPQEIIDLVRFLLSLSDPEARRKAVLRRETISARRVPSLGADASDLLENGVWSDAPSTWLRLMPLWWRDDAVDELTVQAIHDGRHLAIRLRWPDKTSDISVWRTQAFADAAALEWFAGPPQQEPFLGMGTMDEPVELWYWNAARQLGTAVAGSTPEPVPGAPEYAPRQVVDVFPFHERVVTTAEGDRALARTPAHPSISLPALATGNRIVPLKGESGTSVLEAGGPRTVTFRTPPVSVVAARGRWHNGQWTVVFLADLYAGDSLVKLEPGGRLSVAFALFDGSAGDRNGQKQVSIWQDLRLEP